MDAYDPLLCRPRGWRASPPWRAALGRFTARSGPRDAFLRKSAKRICDGGCTLRRPSWLVGGKYSPIKVIVVTMRMESASPIGLTLPFEHPGRSRVGSAAVVAGDRQCRLARSEVGMARIIDVARGAPAWVSAPRCPSLPGLATSSSMIRASAAEVSSPPTVPVRPVRRAVNPGIGRPRDRCRRCPAASARVRRKVAHRQVALGVAEPRS